MIAEVLQSDRSVWLAASKQSSEEEPVLEAFAQLKAEQPNVLLMPAPHRMQAPPPAYQSPSRTMCW